MTDEHPNPPPNEHLIDWENRMKAAWADYHNITNFIFESERTGSITEGCKADAFHQIIKFMQQNDAIRIGAPKEDQIPTPILCPIIRQANVIAVATILKYHPEHAQHLRQLVPSSWPSRAR